MTKLAHELVTNQKLCLELAIELTKQLQKSNTPILTGLSNTMQKRRTNSNESTSEKTSLKRPKLDADIRADTFSQRLFERNELPFAGRRSVV